MAVVQLFVGVRKNLSKIKGSLRSRAGVCASKNSVLQSLGAPAVHKITVCMELEFPIPAVAIFPLSTVAMDTTAWLLTSPEMPPLRFLRNLTLPWQKNTIYFSL